MARSRSDGGVENDDDRAEISGRVVKLPQWLAASFLAAVVAVVGGYVRLENKIAILETRQADQAADYDTLIGQAEMVQAYLFNIRVFLAEHALDLPEPPAISIHKHHGQKSKEE